MTLLARATLAAAACMGAACQASGLPALHDGDIVFHVSRSAQSVAVQRATASPLSHMGMVLLRDGKPYVFEAEATVRYTPLPTWIARGVGGHFILKRLVQPLSTSQAAQLRKAALAFEGKPYDLRFEWSDQRIYCSELVWKIYDRALGVHLGELKPIGEFKLSDPVVQAKARERYGASIPTAELAISPSMMEASPLLATLARR